MRNLVIAATFLLTVSAAHAGDFKVMGRSVQARSVQPQLAGTIHAMESEVMVAKDPHYDGSHAGSTHELVVVPSAGARVVQTRQIDFADQYNVNAAPQFKVTQLGADNILRATALMPVSGHVGYGPARRSGQKLGSWDIVSNKNETAAQYAATNRYNIEVRHVESGKVERFGNIASTGIITAHELEIDMSNKGTYRVQFWPDGSAGVGGYAAGRTVDFIKN